LNIELVDFGFVQVGIELYRDDIFLNYFLDILIAENKSLQRSTGPAPRSTEVQQHQFILLCRDDFRFLDIGFPVEFLIQLGNGSTGALGSKAGGNCNQRANKS